MFKPCTFESKVFILNYKCQREFNKTSFIKVKIRHSYPSRTSPQTVRRDADLSSPVCSSTSSLSYSDSHVLRS